MFSIKQIYVYYIENVCVGVTYVLCYQQEVHQEETDLSAQCPKKPH